VGSREVFNFSPAWPLPPCQCSVIFGAVAIGMAVVGLPGPPGGLVATSARGSPGVCRKDVGAGRAATTMNLTGRQLMRWALPTLLIGYATVHRLGQTYG
jgi:hypothetical protein